MNDISVDDGARPLAGRRVAFAGKLGGVTKRDARKLVRQCGGEPVDLADTEVDTVVIGADEWPIPQQDALLDEASRAAAAAGRLQIISETQFWERLGLVEGEQAVRRHYTPAMLADLLGVSIATIRRWSRRGLIQPARRVHRLEYFDFQEVTAARRLSELLAAGAAPSTIEQKLKQLARFAPEIERPLAQLSVIVEGKEILLRQGEGLIEPGGQFRIDFDALEPRAPHVAAPSDEAASAVVSLADYLQQSPHPQAATADELLRQAADCEDHDELAAAAEAYRTALALGGPRAEICFQLAELLYRMGDGAAARERYYMALEIDEEYVEARANLGCVLAEMGELELAAAAFEGALKSHPAFPDAHYHLARVYDELGRAEKAEQHWRTFLELAPDSSWAEEAAARLGLSTT